MRAAFLALVALGASGCWGENKQLGDDELFRVRSNAGLPAQFVKGALPGHAPPKDGVPSSSTPTADGGAEPVVLPRILELSGPGAPIQGTSDVLYEGHATNPTVAWGVALEGISHGYWVLPTEDPDPAQEGTWFVHARFDFDRAIPAARYRILTIGIDADNRSGPQVVTPSKFCVSSGVPDGYSSCTDVKKVPEAVISLTWDANVDLDLQVRTPEGRLVDPKHPTELPLSDAGTVPAESAQIDRDSNAACTVDGVRTENLVWGSGNVPPHGLYTVYANLFDACKQPSVRFTVSLYLRVQDADGGFSHLVKQSQTASGELLDFQANGGSAIGLYVTQVKL